MLDHLEAEQIVKDCIRRVRGFDGGVDSGQRLQQVGINTADLARDLRDTIATDPEIGVQSIRDHRIALSALNFSTGTKVLQVQNMVLFNAKAPEELDPPIANFSFAVSARSATSGMAGASAGLSLTGTHVARDADSSKARRGQASHPSAKKGGKKGGSRK
jgi:hypothetical protein